MPQYTISSEYFTLARDELAKKRELVLVKHAQELDEFDRQFDKLDQLEADIAAMSERDAKRVPKKTVTIGKPPKVKRVVPSRPVPSGKVWTPEEEERVLAASDAELHEIAAERNVKVSAITKRREIIRKRGRDEEAAVEAEPLVEAERTEPSSSEKPDASWLAVWRKTKGYTDQEACDALIKHTPAPSSAPEMSPRGDDRQDKSTANEAPRATPGRSVTGRLLDNGPLDQREYGRGFESGNRE